MVPKRKVDSCHGSFDIGIDGTKITSTYVGANIDAALEVFMFDDIRSRCDAYVGHVLQLHVPAGRYVDQQFLDIAQTIPCFRYAPDLHFVRPVGNINVTGFFAILAEWSRAEMPAPANDTAEPSTSDTGEARYES